jgi:hypothetical protein
LKKEKKILKAKKDWKHGPEFKPQNCQKKTKNLREKQICAMGWLKLG